MKRSFDFTSSLIGLIILSPIFIFVGIAISFSSNGGIFYKQKRVGKGNKDFTLYKFRSMIIGADAKGLLSVGIYTLSGIHGIYGTDVGILL